MLYVVPLHKGHNLKQLAVLTLKCFLYPGKYINLAGCGGGTFSTVSALHTMEENLEEAGSSTMTTTIQRTMCVRARQLARVQELGTCWWGGIFNPSFSSCSYLSLKSYHEL